MHGKCVAQSGLEDAAAIKNNPQISNSDLKTTKVYLFLKLHVHCDSQGSLLIFQMVDQLPFWMSSLVDQRERVLQGLALAAKDFGRESDTLAQNSFNYN